ncbi:hypothetical protein MAGR_47740 [Mycolicibacterium agri]|uniref:Uncharacterized protein n=1 Tax=Mycolicibacterium agri TaxID=36811 RepID=A0A7I9W6M5_MYCAG|nr:hypothetical protein MAGR_47740 [Mycolicibacterium agri]
MTQYLTCGSGPVEVRFRGGEKSFIGVWWVFAAGAQRYAGAFAALSKLDRSCRRASGEVGQTLVHRVPSGPVV